MLLVGQVRRLVKLVVQLSNVPLSIRDVRLDEDRVGSGLVHGVQLSLETPDSALGASLLHMHLRTDIDVLVDSRDLRLKLLQLHLSVGQSTGGLDLQANLGVIVQLPQFLFHRLDLGFSLDDGRGIHVDFEFEVGGALQLLLLTLSLYNIEQSVERSLVLLSFQPPHRCVELTGIRTNPDPDSTDVFQRRTFLSHGLHRRVHSEDVATTDNHTLRRRFQGVALCGPSAALTNQGVENSNQDGKSGAPLIPIENTGLPATSGRMSPEILRPIQRLRLVQ